MEPDPLKPITATQFPHHHLISYQCPTWVLLRRDATQLTPSPFTSSRHLLPRPRPKQKLGPKNMQRRPRPLSRSRQRPKPPNPLDRLFRLPRPRNYSPRSQARRCVRAPQHREYLAPRGPELPERDQLCGCAFEGQVYCVMWAYELRRGECGIGEPEVGID